MDPQPERRERVRPAWAGALAVAVVLAGLVVLSFGQRYAVLASSPFPLGVDGYFYPVQLRSLLETGALAYAASPLAFWLLAPFAAATDPITGAKLGAAVYGALIALPAYGVAARLARSRTAGVVAAAIATFSAGSQYLTIEFVKNSIGITVGLTALWLVLRALDRSAPDGEPPDRIRPAKELSGFATIETPTGGATTGDRELGTIETPTGGATTGDREGDRDRASRAVDPASDPATIGDRDRARHAVEPSSDFATMVDRDREPAPTADRDRGEPSATGHRDRASRTVGSDRESERSAVDRRKLGRVAVALIGVAGAYLTHKMAAVFVLSIAIPALIADARTTVWRTRAIIAVVVVSAVAVLLGVIAPERFVSAGDLRLVGGLFGGDARWSLPVLDSPRGRLWLGHEPVLAAVAGLAALAVLVGPRLGRRAGARAAAVGPGHRVAAWGFVAFALVLANPWLDVADGDGLGMRLRVVAFVPLAMCAAIVLGALERAWLRPVLARTGVGVALVALVLAIRVISPGTEGRIVTHPALITGVASLAGRVPDGDVVIVPERHIAFMVAWYARLPVRLRPEPVPEARRWRLLPLAFIGLDSPLDDELQAVRANAALPRPLGLHARHPNGLVLVPEATWQHVLSRLPAGTRAHFAAWPTI